ncbi:MAG: hypothetical protein RLY87_1164 [Chloroflexota bacterium]|jgi:DNA processing protein
MHETIALLGLVRIDGLGPLRIARLVEGFGSAVAVWQADRRALYEAGMPAHLIAELVKQRALADPTIEHTRLWNAGIQVVSTADPQYPTLLRHIPGAPTILFVRGSLTGLQLPAVSIVGTREPTSYGIEVTRQFAADLAAKGFTIVSGLAIGVDTIAHHEALAAGGATVAVLPSGVDCIYPERNRRLAEAILGHGQSALVSEFYPGTRASPPLFPARNRLISGLSSAVIVTEAGTSSGAHITVKAALDQGRDVMAVPGSIYSAKSAGCNALLTQGAVPVRDADDVATYLGYVDAAVPDEDPFLVLLNTAIHIDDLCRRTQRSSADLLGDLLMRELRGEVRDEGHGYFVRTRTRSER